MTKVAWPRLRTLLRSLGFIAGLAVLVLAIYSALQTPVVASGAGEPTQQLAPELLLATGACLWMLLLTKL